MDKIHKDDTVILDIGCGQEKMPNSIGVDIRRTKGADVVADIQHLPFKNSSVDKILCYQLLEHVENLIIVMEEIWHVLKPQGEVIIEVPHAKGLDAFRDPTHKNFFTIATMDYFTVKSGFSYYSNAQFKIISRRIIFKNKCCGWLEKIVNLRPEFAEHFLGGNLKPHIVWVLEKEM
jgi:ubiquinone/menaquinone biosynthesis C-methylase UbiE